MTFFHKKAPERTKKERKTGSFIHQGVNCPDAEHTGYRENGNNAESPESYPQAKSLRRRFQPLKDEKRSLESRQCVATGELRAGNS